MTKPVTVFGIDFTSAPSMRKPITCARNRFDGEVLKFDGLSRWDSFAPFEKVLSTLGPWVAGLDFPFGQSRRLIENIGWSGHWAGYVRKVASMERKDFREALEEYKRDRPIGDKHHKRACDVLSRSQSPQSLNYTPVGLMFSEGAPRLLEAGVHLPFHHDGDESRIALEAYPGADDLDAVICAVQAAWHWTRRDEAFGAPGDVDRLEGWITDPLLEQRE